MIDVLTQICNRIWRTGEWFIPWLQSLIITLLKKGNLQLCQNYKTTSLVSHFRVMLKVILNRQICVKSISNISRICTMSSLISKKAFDRIWHAALWATMRKYNISANLVPTTEQLYGKATSAVQMNGSIRKWFRATVGVRQGSLQSPTPFNIFLERIMSDAPEEHDGKVNIGGRNITNLRFADDIDALAEEECELEAVVETAQGIRWRSVPRTPN